MKSLIEQLRLFFGTYRRTELRDSPYVRAAVLMVFFEREHQPYVLLTKRTEDVEHHKGQISFPGGVVDPLDRDMIATALRETQEEIGLSAGSVEIAGIYDDFSIPTGFVVTPVVGYVEQLPLLHLNKAEVETALEVPLSFLLDSQNRKIVRMMRGGEPRDVYFFHYGEHEIWGATAAIIDSFLRKVGPLMNLADHH